MSTSCLIIDQLLGIIRFQVTRPSFISLEENKEEYTQLNITLRLVPKERHWPYKPSDFIG